MHVPYILTGVRQCLLSNWSRSQMRVSYWSNASSKRLWVCVHSAHCYCCPSFKFWVLVSTLFPGLRVIVSGVPWFPGPRSINLCSCWQWVMIFFVLLSLKVSPPRISLAPGPTHPLKPGHAPFLHFSHKIMGCLKLLDNKVCLWQN